MTQGVVILGHKPGAYGEITPTTATKLDPSSLFDAEGQPAVEAYVSVEDHPVRLRVDGGVPNANDGHLYVAGEKVTIRGNAALHNLTFIDTSDGPSRVFITVLF